MSQLTGKKIAIIAADYFEEVELISPRDALQEAGATVEIVAPHGGQLKSLNHIRPGEAVQVDKRLSDADSSDYDAVVVPGGVVNSDHLRVDVDAQAFIHAMNEAGKPIAVICHGPWLLVSSGLAEGRTLTSYHTLQDDIRNAGGMWLDQEVVTDNNLITSRNPDDLPAFNQALLDALGS